MSDDLVKRKLTIDPMPRKDLAAPPPIGYVARADYEALTAERDALIRDRDRWAAEAQVNTSPIVAGLTADNARLRGLEADNARLREALKEQIHIHLECHLMPCAAPGNDTCECERIYRAALTAGKETK